MKVVALADVSLGWVGTGSLTRGRFQTQHPTYRYDAIILHGPPFRQATKNMMLVLTCNHVIPAASQTRAQSRQGDLPSPSPLYCIVKIVRTYNTVRL